MIAEPAKSEQHERGYRGTWIPWYVMDMLEEGTLGPREILLLAVIDSFSRGPDGCFASNAYLASRIGVGADRVKQMLSTLKAVGLVSVVVEDYNRRTIKSLCSERPKAPEEGEQLPTAGHGEKSPGDGKILPGGGENFTPRGEENYPILEKNRTQRHTHSFLSERTGGGPPAEPAVSPGSRRGKSGRNGKVKRTDKIKRTDLLSSDFDRRAAGYLRSLLIEHDADLVNPSDPKQRPVGVDTLAERITVLRTQRQVPEQEIKSVLQWYRKAYGGEYVPQLRRADDLLKWARLREAKQRWETYQAEVKADWNDETDEDRGGPKLKFPRMGWELGKLQDKWRFYCEATHRTEGYPPASLMPMVDEWAVELGFKPGEVEPMDVLDPLGHSTVESEEKSIEDYVGELD